ARCYDGRPAMAIWGRMSVTKRADRAGKSPLWAVLVFSWISSVGTGLTANGIYFLTKHAYGFGVAENYLLGLAMGVAYIGGALGGGRRGSLRVAGPRGREPGVPLEGEHGPDPPVYRSLLATFRVLLPTSYMVLTALSPYLPAALTSMQVREGWQTPVAATWTV